MNTFFDRRDPLTGLLNRHGFGKELERAIARFDRFGHRLAVLWIDLLGLEEVEEQQGREAADNHRLEAAMIGPSALDELTRLPLDKLKIDQAFIQRLPADRRSVAVVRAALGLARSLGLHLVAEGVESAAQLEFLRAEGCHEAQGYHLGRPMAADDLADRLLET